MKNILLSLTIAVAFTSCAGGGGDSVKDTAGNCTSEAVSAHNEIIHKAKMYDLSKDRDYLVGMNNACKSFKSLIGTKTCTALNTKTNAEETMSYSKVESACSAAMSAVSSIKPVSEEDTQTATEVEAAE